MSYETPNGAKPRYDGKGSEWSKLHSDNVLEPYSETC